MKHKKIIELNKIAAFMEDTLNEHGNTALGVGWKTQENQNFRFKQFLSMFKDEGKAFSINDFGCGLAGLFTYLNDQKLEISDYYGYDISDSMIKTAKEIITDSRVNLIKSDRLTSVADYSIACGIFNTRLDESESAWSEYMKSVIFDLSKNSTKAFAFNSLTSFVDWKKDHLFYADPTEYFNFCKREISPYVTLLHDYPLYEWTIIVRQTKK